MTRTSVKSGFRNNGGKAGVDGNGDGMDWEGLEGFSESVSRLEI